MAWLRLTNWQLGNNCYTLFGERVFQIETSVKYLKLKLHHPWMLFEHSTIVWMECSSIYEMHGIIGL